MSQIGSKLAGSVRQAKAQQADKTTTEPVAPVKPATKREDAPLPIIPSRRVWPD